MRSLHVKQAATAAVLLVLPLSLAACSSSSSPEAASSSPTAHTTSSAPAPGTTPDDSSTTSANGAKPTKAQVAAGMTDYFVGKGVPRSLVGGVATCVANKGYSQFSDATLRALKDGRVQDLNPLDTGKLTKVTTTCLASGPAASFG
ncbi:hypothetical protein [Flexivirga oryzae]|uniref:DUF732 domain-containing protein n=1 Tax=Flexivirga oryzae TaxID=1794944 RepID=A0A839N705_9MICO|nr:hypothetical protein [Flexivirga oryzae]MBB2892539.1 hypothetical protein [Flexivirga oryzae]